MEMPQFQNHKVPWGLPPIKEQAGRFAAPARRGIHQSIRLAYDYIREHYHQPVTLKQVADVVHLNPVYFSVMFKKEAGMNFSHYLIRYRLEIAKKLLQDGRLNISEVARQVGYQDPKYFSKLFRKTVGFKPAEYRRIPFEPSRGGMPTDKC